MAGLSTPMDVVLDEDRHWWFATRTRAILAYLDRFAGPDGYPEILDVGCGAANMTHHLRHYGRVRGVDNNPRPLEVARRRGLDAVQGSAEELPFAGATFDLVALLDTIEHVPGESRVLSECRRVLRPGGKLLVTVPAFQFLWSHNDVINRHQRRYTAGSLRARLAGGGFRPLRVSYTHFLTFHAAAALILLRRGRAEPDLASPHLGDDAYQVEMEPASPLVNQLLDAVGKAEAGLLRHVSLPWGTSVIALAACQE
ncbi:MAG TPA: class I SAM-dependent methyltransferase [Anaerolineae bacterium]|nr:class I SAM-dependent methyltransferase [Anaerolineae bacterium]